jgi:hypothetical protein
MKLGTCVFLGATGLSALGLVTVMQGCGGSSSTSPGADSGTGATGSDSGTLDSGGDGSTGATGATGPGTVPPALPSGATATTSTTPQNFALHHIHLGDETDPVYGAQGWKRYGYNIDGLDSTSPSATNSCIPSPTMTSFKDQIDGPGGIDNSFGANIVVPLLSLLVTNPSQTINTSLEEGKFTFLINVTGLSGAAGQTASGLSGSLFGGLSFGDAGAPTFTTADNWPISTTYITSSVGADGKLAQPIVATINLSGAYVVNGTVVSGAPQAVGLALTIGGYQITVPIEHALLTFQNPGDAGASQASGGIISGVINTAQLLTALGPIAADNMLCGELPAITPAIQQAADILDDGTNEPGKPCSAISIGIGFDADEIAQPTIGETPPIGAANCGGDDAGSDAGTDAG